MKDYKKIDYSTNWFNPEPRSFDHTARLLKQLIMMPLPDEAAFNIDLALSDVDLYAETLDMIDSHSNRIARIEEKPSDSYNFRTLKCKYESVEGYSDYMAVVNIGDDITMVKGNEFEFVIPNYYEGGIRVTVMMKDKDGEIYYSSKDMLIEGFNANPISLDVEDLYLETGQATYPVVTCHWSDTTNSRIVPEEVTFSEDGVAEWNEGEFIALQPGTTKATIKYQGISRDIIVKVFGQEIKAPVDNSDAICSTVTLSFKQSMYMTRQGFNGTFTLKNGHTSGRLRDFRLNLEITDEGGFTATRREFETVAQSITGFHGDLNLDSGWTLDPSTDGTVNILFIPSRYAALSEPKKYNFGGTFSYVDPITGLKVTHDITPVTLTVNPSPVLDLNYFMQRDVLADDPLTPGITERNEPVEFALVISNKGYGDAKNLRFITNQPEIIDNEKGLLIDFEIESSQLNGSQAALSFGESIVNDFGTIPAGESAYAQWWFRSTLPGYFSSYQTSATHITSYGNPDLTLVDETSVHELIHGFTISKDSESPIRGFLVNDIEDPDCTPDRVYFSDGTEKNSVGFTSNAELHPEGLDTYQLVVNSNSSGWVYGYIKDPTNGKGKVMSVRRMADGTLLPSDNFWTTDRTFVNGHDPIYENRLHFIVNNNIPSSYIIEFTDLEDSSIGIETIDPVYYELDNGDKYVTAVKVKFTNTISPDTFTSEDILLHHDGKVLIPKELNIITDGPASYIIDFGKSAVVEGHYTFTIDLSNIYDELGNSGNSSKSISWDQCILTGVSTPLSTEGIHVWPNPMRSVLHIDTTLESTAFVTVVNSLGEVMYYNSNFTFGDLIDVSDWQPGIYILNISSEGRDLTIKCIKR